MAFQLEFYRTESGDEPALDYIRSQAKAHRAKIGRALQYLEDVGNLARRPQADYLVVTTGILKNEGKVPQAELERARRYRADWLARFGGKGS